MRSLPARLLAIAVTIAAAAFIFYARLQDPPPTELEAFVAREDRLEEAVRRWEAENEEGVRGDAYAREYSTALDPASARKATIETVHAAVDSADVLLLGESVGDPMVLPEHVWFIEALAARVERPLALVVERFPAEASAGLESLRAEAVPAFLSGLAAKVAPLPPPPAPYVALLQLAVEKGIALLPGDSLAAFVAAAERVPGAWARRDKLAAERVAAWRKEHPDGLCIGLFTNPRLLGAGHLRERLEGRVVVVLRSDDRLLRRVGVAWEEPALLVPIAFPGDVFLLPLRTPAQTIDWAELEKRERAVRGTVQLIQGVADSAR